MSLKSVLIGLASLAMLACSCNGVDEAAYVSYEAENQEEVEQVIVTKPEDIASDYEENQAEAELKYEDSLIQMQGAIIGIGIEGTGAPYIVLGKVVCIYQQKGVVCLFENASEILPLLMGQLVTVQGRSLEHQDGVRLENCQVVSIP